MSGRVFIVLYVSVSVIAGAVWLLLRSRRRPVRDDSPMAAPIPNTDNPFLLGFVSPYGGSLLIGAVLTLLSAGVKLAAPWPLLVVVDHGILDKPLPAYLAALDGVSATELIAIGAGAVVVLVALGTGLGYVATRINGSVRSKIEADIRSAAFVRLQDASVSVPETYRSRDLLGKLSVDLDRLGETLGAWFGSVLPEMPTVIGVLVVMTFVDPVFAVATLVVVPVLVWWVRRTHPPVGAGDRIAATSRDVFGRGAPNVVILVATGVAAVLYLGATQVLSDDISMGMLLVLLAYTAQLYAPMGNLAISVLTMVRGAVNRGLLPELFATERQAADSADAIEAPTGPLPLRVHDVAFGYDNTWPVLRDVNFSVAPGEVVCVLGSRGTSRSSLLALLVRLYDPATGGIELAGIDIRDLTRASVRSRIALVPHDTGVIDGTIASNIAFGWPGATPEDIARAARLAMADEFIDAFPAAYDTFVGDRGAVLTGAQRFKLAMARALIRNAPILILDEPTAGLDPVSAGQVWRAASQMGAEHAVIVVTEDLEVAKRADRVYVMDKGATVEGGNHETLLGHKGRYSALWSDDTSSSPLPAESPAVTNLEPAPASGPVSGTTTEKLLGEVLAQVLSVERVSPDGHFFDDLGADSMVMARFCARLRKQTDLPPVAMKQVYEHPTISGLATALADRTPHTATEQLLGDVLAEVVGVERIPADSHFFDDLGADSMVMARFCARLRKQTDLPPVAMKQVYEHPTIAGLAGVLTGAAPVLERATERSATRPPAQAPQPVGPLGHALCGAVQMLTLLAYLSLLAFALARGAGWIVQGSTLQANFLRSIAVGNALVVGVVLFPLVVKWLLVGRWQPEQFRVWSATYVRFWIVKTFVTVNPIALFAGTPIFLLYLRALGAKIGRNVVVLSRRVPVCTDLLTIGDNTVIRKDALLNCYRAHSGLIQTGRVTLGRNVYVGELTVLDIDTAMGDGSQLAHSSSLLAGQSIPAGEHRCGSPAVERTDVQYGDVPAGSVTMLRKGAFSAVQLLNWLVSSSLVFSIFFLVGSALAERAYFADSATAAFSGPVIYIEAFVIAGILLFAVIVLRLAFATTVPRLLDRAIEPGTVYPLYGLHYLLHRGVGRLTNITFFTHLFGDSSYIVPYLRSLGYDLSDSVVQTGSNFGSAVKHDNPYLVSIGRGTMIADGLSLINADYSNTSFRLSPVSIGADNFLGNQVAYPSQGRTRDNCLLATKVMVPVDGEVREGVGLLGSPSFEIPRSVLRDSGLNHPKTDADRDHRLAGKNRHNLGTIGLFLAGEWLFFCGSVLLGFGAVILSTSLGPFVFALAALVALVGRVLYQALLEHASRSFRPLTPLQCSIYEPDFWSHERYWKLAVRNVHLSIFAGTPLKPLFFRLMGAKIGRRVFDDGGVITERTLVAIGDHCTLNMGSVVQSHSQEDGGFKRDRIVIGAGCTVGANALVHYGVTMGDGAQLAPGAFLMKGSEVPPHTRWEHNPAQQVEGDDFVHAAMRAAERIRRLGDGVRDEMAVKQLA